MKFSLLLCTWSLLLLGCSTKPATDPFVRVENGQFVLDGKPLYFIGTNFWYGAILGSQGQGGDRDRLHRELDNLAANGITNLRVLVGADGVDGTRSKVAPTLQRAPGDYNDDVLDGLDYLMQQLDLRGMKAVLYLTNAWEWSGGYGQYLEWANGTVAPLPADNWPTYVKFVKEFVGDKKALGMFADHVRFIVGRTNRYTGLKYTDDPAIFSWQICNEPRAFSDEKKELFYIWIGETARTIRSIDTNHLISTGSEGIFGCEVDASLAERIHAIPEIGYLTLHIWPYNWKWVEADHLGEQLQAACDSTRTYIDRHLDIAARLHKPAVIEEFGFPRDSFRFERGTPTTLRDDYYRSILDRVVRSKAEGGLLAGCNFWGWGGDAHPAHLYWQTGDAYCNDPAQEQQGLNSVFDDDSTVAIIAAANQQLQ